MLPTPNNENKQNSMQVLCANRRADDRADLQWDSSLEGDVGCPEQASDQIRMTSTRVTLARPRGLEVASQVHARPEMHWQVLGRGEGDVQYACLGFEYAQTS